MHKITNKYIINLTQKLTEKALLAKARSLNFTKMSPSPSTAVNKTSIQNTDKPIAKPIMLTISVDGNISSGKSTLVSALEDLFPKDFNYAVETVPEPLGKWTNMHGHNLLGMLYQDPTKNNFMFQHYVQLTRLMDTIRESKENHKVSDDGYVGKIRIMERSIQNNRYCFSELARRQGTLHEAEFSVLAEWYKWLNEHLDLSMDLIIYLRTSPEVVFDRMKNRGRAEEATVPLDYLSNLHETYEDWLVRETIVEEKHQSEDHIKEKQKVIVIDANKSQTEVAQQCRELIREHLKN